MVSCKINTFSDHVTHKCSRQEITLFHNQLSQNGISSKYGNMVKPVSMASITQQEILSL